MARADRNEWRARMAVRGGRFSHLLARAGWLLGAGLGAIAMIIVAVIFAADPGEADLSASEAFIGGFIVFTPIGAVMGALVGLPAQFAARAWLRDPTPDELRATALAKLAARRKILPAHGLQPLGRWARFYESCARSVAAYHAVVDTVPEGAGRDWLADIGKTLDDELDEALRLSKLGESLEPADLTEPGETAYRVLERLRAAKKSFDETTERAAAIALDLRDDSDFVRVRAQLDMLAEQAPRLRDTNTS
jgi:hypothetical protein